MKKSSRVICSALCAVGMAVSASASAGAPLPAGISSHDAKVNGMTLHYLQSGDGKGMPVVLLHGYTETSHMWLPLMAQLKGRTVIAVDLPGEGDSSMPETGYDKKTMAQDIHGLIKQLGYPKAQLVGHDIGLMVAYAYAAQYPQEVQSLTLMDAFLPGVGDWQKVWLLRDKWHFNFYGETPLKLVQGRERIYFEHFWNDFAADPKHSLSEAEREYYTAQYARPGRMRAGFEYFHTFTQDAQDFAELAKIQLPMPVQVIAGEKASGQFLVTQAKLIAPNVDGVIVPGSGHWLMEEAPETTIPAIIEFLNKTKS
jgi:pimeloyl-ACP methyl ester carboxylesterase